MKETFAEILIFKLKALLPFFATLCFVLADFVPIHVPLSHFLRPDLALACVYFWVLYRNDLFGIFSCLILGAIVDYLSGAPLGMNVLVFVFSFIFTVKYAGYLNPKPFIVTWVAFGLISFGAFILKWGLFCLYDRAFLPFSYILTTYLTTFFLYPLVAKINIWLQNKFLGEDEQIYE